MKLLVDMDFDAAHADALRSPGVQVVHWSEVGEADDLDPVLVAWAKARRHVLVTQDLGIAGVLARTGADAPSVIQLRRADDLNPLLLAWVGSVARSHARELDSGCILVLGARTLRVRVRPLSRRRSPGR